MPFDKQNYIGVLEDFSNQCKKALDLSREMVIKEPISNIIIAGMGGSAIAGDILKSYMTNTGIPLAICRDYVLPSYTNNQTLVFVVSYSGNTEETLSVYKQAIEKKAIVWSISSGGILSKESHNLIKIPQGLQPRAAVGYLFFPILRILFNSNIIVVTNAELNEMLGILKKVDVFKDNAQSLAMKIKNKIPIIYSSKLFEPVAYRIKCEINENSKHPAFYNVFPEMNHNEIVGYKNMDRKNFVAIFIRDAFDNERIKKRMDITKEIIENNLDVIEIPTQGKYLLSRIFSGIYLGDFVSYYLAGYHRVDPTPVAVIEELKEELMAR